MYEWFLDSDGRSCTQDVFRARALFSRSDPDIAPDPGIGHTSRFGIGACEGPADLPVLARPPASRMSDWLLLPQFDEPRPTHQTHTEQAAA